MNLASFPVPAPVRSWLLRKAVWDYLRTQLSFDGATRVKADAEAAVIAAIDDVIAGAKS